LEGLLEKVSRLNQQNAITFCFGSSFASALVYYMKRTIDGVNKFDNVVDKHSRFTQAWGEQHS